MYDLRNLGGPQLKILETPRLILREMTLDDDIDLCKMLQDPEVMYAYAHSFSDEEVRTWLNNQLRRYKEDGFGLWAVVLKGINEMIGQCGLTRQEFFEPVVEGGLFISKTILASRLCH